MKMFSVAVVSLCFLAATTAVGTPPIDIGGESCSVWAIESPAAEASGFPNDAAISCSGTASEPDVVWVCRITQSSNVIQSSNVGGTGDLTSAVAGTSTGIICDALWSGQVAAPAGGWYPRSTQIAEHAATVSLRAAGDLVEVRTIYFSYPGM